MKTLMISAVIATEKGTDKPLLDKNGNHFHIVEVSTPETIYEVNSRGEKMPIKQKPQYLGGITGWEKSYTPSAKGRPDYEFTLEEDTEVQGDIVNREVTDLKGKPVFIADSATQKNPGPDTKDGKTGRFVKHIRMAVFANSDDKTAFDIEVGRAYKRKGYLVVNASTEVKAAVEEVAVQPALEANPAA